MTSKSSPKKPSPAPKPAKSGLKPLPFSFPFLRKGQGKSEASSRFTDEHEIHRLLAEREPSGAYLVSNKGMWHGGIHVTEAGAGQALDLEAGVRCIADGHVIAYRIDRDYPTSEISAADSQATASAPYSTGFALVRHTMAFPKGTTLTFYSLYMHLMSCEDYANFRKRRKPAYWPVRWQVTEFAQDRPSVGKSGQVADAGQRGLRVRKSHPKGEIIGIVPGGAHVSIGKQQNGWGQVKDLHGASLYPAVAGGFVPPSAAIGGWVCDFNFAGGRVTREFAQKWIDFACVADAHDPAHTIFATTREWIEYASGANVADPAARSKLSPLMLKAYDALFTKGDGRQAADELCTLSQTEGDGYPWRMQAASRLIVKHESEWANPSKWKPLIAELEKQTGPKPQYEEEQKRIERLAWWDEVKAGVPGFPEPDVFHINPIAPVANFALGCDCKTRFEKISKIVLINEGGFVNDPNDSGGATNKGIAWATWQAYAREDIGVEPTLENLKALSDDQANVIYLRRYWEPRGFCGVLNEKTALNIYDWAITSGRAIMKIRELLIRNTQKKSFVTIRCQNILSIR
ncbi:PG_binding_3 domain-containing protein [Burkholderia multivorans]